MLFESCAHRGVAFAREPALNAFAFHGGGEGLVEHGVIGNIHDLVCQFVENQAGEFGIGIGHDGIEHRIVEPAQRGIGRHAADMDIQSLGAQFLAEFLGTGLIEISAIGHATGEEKTPLQWRERELRRCKDVPDHERATQVSVTAVAAVVGQGQIRGREIAHAQHHLQTRAQCRRGFLILDYFRDCAAALPDLHLPFDRLVVVTDTRAAAKVAGKRKHADQSL